jgi:hypothetical protein
MVKQLEASPSIQKMVEDIAEGIAANKTTPFDAMLQFCKLCEVLRSGDLICDWHKECLTIPEACNVCPTSSDKKQ